VESSTPFWDRSTYLESFYGVLSESGKSVAHSSLTKALLNGVELATKSIASIMVAPSNQI